MGVEAVLDANDASLTNWELVYRHPVQVIGFNLGTHGRARTGHRLGPHQPCRAGGLRADRRRQGPRGAGAPHHARQAGAPPVSCSHSSLARHEGGGSPVCNRFAVREDARMKAAHDRFTAQTSPHRRELRAFCYRMAGATGEADDLVQETYLRAWRALLAVSNRHQRLPRRAGVTPRPGAAVVARPSALERPPIEPADAAWIEPMPDAWLASSASRPADAAIHRDSLRLALSVSLQALPTRQRAILILRDLLAFSARDTAQVLELTPVTIKSGLQRARARLEALTVDREALLEPADPRRCWLRCSGPTPPSSRRPSVAGRRAACDASPAGDLGARRAGRLEAAAHHRE